MLKYPKIETLFVRDDKHKVTSQLRINDFDNIKNCIITEKINGTNAQIVLSINYDTLDVKVRFCSRENEIERKDIMFIADTCCKKLKLDKIAEFYHNEIALNQKEAVIKDNATELRLYGEVYGDRINEGGIYCGKGIRDFRLFDIQIGSHFASYDNLCAIAERLEIKVVPIIYEGPILDLLEYEKLKGFLENFKTRIIGEGGTGGLAEGIVVRPEPLLLNRFGERIIIKIKRSDFTYEVKKEVQLTIDEINPEDIDRRDGVHKEESNG
jgi:hypothetical protein